VRKQDRACLAYSMHNLIVFNQGEPEDEFSCNKERKVNDTINTEFYLPENGFSSDNIFRVPSKDALFVCLFHFKLFPNSISVI
jgi:hypothetical protein